MVAFACTGFPLHVEIYDANPPDSVHSLDELRFRGHRYPVGTQTGELYTIVLDTAAPMEHVVTEWERPTIRFYRYYGDAGYKQKAILRFQWVEHAQILQGVSIKRPIPGSMAAKWKVRGKRYVTRCATSS